MHTSKNFYSFVVPAHNEEDYIEQLILSVAALDFPSENYELIVAENGSTDNTLGRAEKHTANNIHIVSCPKKGVSHARNFGAEQVSKQSTWIIFMDADCIVHKKFLLQLDNFLNDAAKGDTKYVGGTTFIRPVEKNFVSNFWYGVINLTRVFTKYPWTVQILRKDLFGQIRYDEEMTYGEDIKISQDITRTGKQFLLNTDQVETSTRRFTKVGWLRTLSSWLFVWSLPNKEKKKKVYNVVR